MNLERLGYFLLGLAGAAAGAVHLVHVAEWFSDRIFGEADDPYESRTAPDGKLESRL